MLRIGLPTSPDLSALKGGEGWKGRAEQMNRPHPRLRKGVLRRIALRHAAGHRPSPRSARGWAWSAEGL